MKLSLPDKHHSRTNSRMAKQDPSDQFPEALLICIEFSWHAQDVLKYYGAKKYGSGPPALGERSPRESYNPEAEDFMRERGSYQNPPEHP